MADHYLEDLSCEERQLFALYAQYPEISFALDDLGMCPPEDLNLLPEQGQAASARSSSLTSPSSPVSASFSDQRSELATAGSSETTTTTAPATQLRVPGPTMSHDQTLMRIGSATDEGTLEYFLQLVEINGQSPEMKEFFTWISTTMANIGQDLFPVDVDRPLPHIDIIYAQSRSLFRELIKRNLEVIRQREQVTYLKSLQAFNVNPTDEFVWTVFKQRAELISNHVSLPSKEEMTLLDALVVLFHVQMYDPFMEFIEKEEAMEDRFMRIFNAMFEKVTNWLSLYQAWWADMVDLQQNYTLPLWSRIRASEDIRAEIRSQLESHQAAVEAANETSGIMDD